MESQRHNFSLPPDLHYLNAAYMSPLAKRVEAAGVAGVRRKADPTTIHADDFFRDSDRARSLFGELVNAPASRMAVVPAVSYGVALAARNLEVGKGRRIVVAAEQFPSNALPWRTLARERGAELVTVARAPAAEWSGRVMEAVDRDTAVVALPHVHWTDGTLFDLEAIGARAREVGAALVVDGTQSVGALPFDVGRIRPDALVCAGYKWLMGPYSLGLAYFGERFDGALPLEETWLGREGSDDFRGLVNYRDAYRAGMDRLDVGERSSFHLMPMLVESLTMLLEWGAADVQAYVRALTAPLVERARAAGFEIADPAHRASHLFGIRAPEGVDLEALRTTLEARRVVISLRGTAVRVSPHVYNEPDDVEALATALESAAPASPTPAPAAPSAGRS